MEFSMWRPFWIVDMCLVPVCDIAPNGRCEGDKGEEDAAGSGHVVRQEQSVDENDVGDEMRRRGRNRLWISKFRSHVKQIKASPFIAESSEVYNFHHTNVQTAQQQSLRWIHVS